VNNYAPVVLFVYNRPRNTLRELEVLANESHLIVFCDGTKSGADKKSLDEINEVRAIVGQKEWCKTVEIIESGKNIGLANSIKSFK
jgi:GT2 family glycosyltransferase